MALVEELQRDALDGNVKVADLLRKALVVATKLHLDEFKTWVNHELNGYADQEVPSYRIIHGTVLVPAPGGFRAAVLPTNLRDEFSQHHERNPVGVLDDALFRHATHYAFPCQLSPVKQRVLRERLNIYDPRVEIAVAAFVRILDTVRNSILTWSLKLEAESIRGEGMSFTPKEQALAKEHAPDFQPVINNIVVGSADRSAIQQSSQGTTQKIN